MYLNKTAERTEEIISVPRIIEMSCRITQRRQTGMHSSKQQRCHWHLLLFSFTNYSIAKVVKVQWKQSKMSCRKTRGQFVSALMREVGWKSVGDTWKYHRRTGLLGGNKKEQCGTRTLGGCFVKQRNNFLISLRRVALFAWSLHDPLCCFPCSEIFLPVCGDTCWCRAACKKPSCPVRPASLTTAVTWWASVWVVHAQSHVWERAFQCLHFSWILLGTAKAAL